MDYVELIVKALCNTLGEMSPYLLFGFFMAGVLSTLLSPEFIERHLGGDGLWPVFKASLFGVPLPLCSCGVIPVAVSLRRHGASRGATTGFLLSTPQTGIDSIFATFSLLGIVYAVFRPVAALVTGVFGGALVSVFDPSNDRKDTPQPPCTDACCRVEKGRGKLKRMLHYGFVTLPEDIAKPLLVGLVMAALISAFIPEDLFAGRLGTGFTGMLLMMICGIPMYVCATASIPVAAALIIKGVSPGAALVFLMTGPATNLASIATIWKIMGARTTVIYLGSVVVAALGFGLLLDLVFKHPGIPQVGGMGGMLPIWVKVPAALGLLVITIRPLLFPSKGEDEEELAKGEFAMELTFTISGMTCQHCVESVRRALSEGAGVESVHVDLKGSRAVVAGDRLDAESLAKAIDELGYKVEATAPGGVPGDDDDALN